MTSVPPESIYLFSTIKPSTVTVWCLLCEAKTNNRQDVYLEQETAAKAGIEKSAYYNAFEQLERLEWIKYSRKKDGKKYWQLLKGFNQEISTNVENSTNMESSTNVDKIDGNTSTNTENSTNVEKQNSTNVEPPQTPQKVYISQKQNSTQESNDSFVGDAAKPPSQPNDVGKSPKKKKERDKRLDHPAIKTVLKIMTIYPLKDLWDRIIREIGDKPDEEFLKLSYERWRSLNGNKQNLEMWLFEPNKTGKLPVIFGKQEGEEKSNGNGNTKGYRPTQDAGATQRTEQINTIITDANQRFKRPELK